MAKICRRTISGISTKPAAEADHCRLAPLGRSLVKFGDDFYRFRWRRRAASSSHYALRMDPVMLWLIMPMAERGRQRQMKLARLIYAGFSEN